MITLYTKPDCPHCVKAKELMSKIDHQFEEFEVGRNITREQVLAKFPDAKSVPIIVWDDMVIAGSSELQSLIDQGILR